MYLAKVFGVVVGLFALGQFSAILKFGEACMYLFDAGVLVFVVLGIITFAIKRNFHLAYVFIPFYYFIFWAIISLLLSLNLYSVNQVATGSLYLVRFAIYISAGLVLYNALQKALISEKYVINILCCSGVLLVFAGLLQLLLLPDFSKLDPALGWDPHKNRLASTLFDPNFTGAYLTIIFTILIDKLTQSKFKTQVTDVLTLIFICLGIFLTFSRSAWLMSGAVIFIFGVARSRWLLYTSILIMFLAYFAVPRIQTRIAGITDPTDSARYRFESWQNSLTIIKDNPLVGVGFNNYRYVQREYGFLDADTFFKHSGAGADASLLFVTAVTGIFGLLLYCYAVFNVLYVLCKQRSSKYLLTLAVTVGLFGNALFINSLFFPQILFVWVSLLCVNSISRT